MEKGKVIEIGKKQARKALVSSKRIDISFLNTTLNAPKMNKCGMGFCGQCQCGRCGCADCIPDKKINRISLDEFAKGLNRRYLEIYVKDADVIYRAMI